MRWLHANFGFQHQKILFHHQRHEGDGKKQTVVMCLELISMKDRFLGQFFSTSDYHKLSFESKSLFHIQERNVLY